MEDINIEENLQNYTMITCITPVHSFLTCPSLKLITCDKVKHMHWILIDFT